MENSTETDLNKSPGESDKTADSPSESVWGNFKSIFPFLSVFIILLGLIKQGFYYDHFNIGIQDYISVSELILATANAATYLIYFVLLYGYSIWSYEKKASSLNYIETMKKRNEKWWKNFPNELIMLVITIVANIVLYIIGQRIIILFVLIADVIYIYPIISYFIEKEFTNPKEKNFNQKIILIPLSLGIIMIFYIIGLDLIQAAHVEKGEYTGTKIYTKDSTYVSDSIHYYIGKTSNFYFIYDKDKKSSTIIPEREVTKFELKENKVSIPFWKMKGF